ncbi:MAG: hypothetical protein Q4G69_02615 [Planctomycetia bacterium]|nr:hypothetical protein [Planctomycetia bacterium]
MSGSKKFIFLFLIFLFSFLNGNAEDSIQDAILYESAGQQKELSGKILNLTGAEGLIVLQKGSQVPDYIPISSIIEIRTSKCDAHKAGDRAFEEGEKNRTSESFSKAVDYYREARKNGEKRPWMRAWITSLIVKSLKGAGRETEAVQEFLILCQIDPLSPYLDSIPLQWIVSRSMAPEKRIELEQIVLPWINSQQNPGGKPNPTAQLLAASFLLESSNGPYRQIAADALEALILAPSSNQGSSARKDLALLATAQLWRLKMHRSLSENEISFWKEMSFRLSPSLQAGPIFLTGKAFLKIGQKEKAKELLLRIPILYPLEKDLSQEAMRLLPAEK